eukprot:TRINITY_DN519_c0_g1_i2.p2 TRINITY_DN519_c0_g1~~TRINITY_DN519_c0_g1_i2.p2  ORF type:complete len:239 (-),score=89.08 TRINITY_DN519_c0_g1_i2:22-738(-)
MVLIAASYCEYSLVSAAKAVVVPESIDCETAGAVLLQGLTAHYLAHDSYCIKEGDTVLVHAGAGGTGGLLIQMAKGLGATVITTVSTDEKAEVVKEKGADYIIKYTEEDFEEQVMKITDGAGCNAVYDGVGKATFDKSLACVCRRGTLVSFGQSSGLVDPFVINRLSARSMSLVRPKLGDYIASREEFETRCASLFELIEAGTVKVHIGQSFSLEEAGAAHDALEGRKTIGKIVLKKE